MYICLSINVSVWACVNQEVCYDISYQIQMITKSRAHIFSVVCNGYHMDERPFSQIQKLNVLYCFVLKTVNGKCKL